MTLRATKDEAIDTILTTLKYTDNEKHAKARILPLAEYVPLPELIEKQKIHSGYVWSDAETLSNPNSNIQIYHLKSKDGKDVKFYITEHQNFRYNGTTMPKAYCPIIYSINEIPVHREAMGNKY